MADSPRSSRTDEMPTSNMHRRTPYNGAFVAPVAIAVARGRRCCALRPFSPACACTRDMPLRARVGLCSRGIERKGSTVLYFSVYKRDALFGASLDAYSCHWRGASEANPEYDCDEMYKAVRWGICSAASTAEPVASVFVLPVFKDSSKHMRLLQHKLARDCIRPSRQVQLHSCPVNGHGRS